MAYEKKILIRASMMHGITNNSWTCLGLWAGNAGQAENGVETPLLFDVTLKRGVGRIDENQGGGGSTNRMNFRLNNANSGHEAFFADTELAGTIIAVESDVNGSEDDFIAMLRQRTGTGRRVEYVMIGVYTS